MLTFASSTFTQIKLPIVNQLRTTGDLDQIVELWIQRTRMSVVFYVFGGLFLLAVGNPILQMMGSKTMLLPTGQLALALLVIGLGDASRSICCFGRLRESKPVRSAGVAVGRSYSHP